MNDIAKAALATLVEGLNAYDVMPDHICTVEELKQFEDAFDQEVDAMLAQLDNDAIPLTVRK